MLLWKDVKINIKGALLFGAFCLINSPGAALPLAVFAIGAVGGFVAITLADLITAAVPHQGE